MKKIFISILIFVFLLAGCSSPPPAATTTTQQITTTAPTTTTNNPATTTTTSTTAITTTSTTTTTTSTTSTTTTTLSECDKHCKARNYISGVCRKSDYECRLRQEQAYAEKSLCPTPGLNFCCCRSLRSV